MAKLTLSDVTNLQNENSAVSTMATNNDLIEAAIENTLSRDGTSPNTMLADLDMNSKKILNLPNPSTNKEPVTKAYGDAHYGDSLASANAAAASATAAATSATSASTSATAAATSATSSATSATSSATSATASAASAVTAANVLASTSFKYTFNSGTTAVDPTSGKLSFNNAAIGSATALYISETDANGNSIAAEIQRWDDNTNTAGRARLKIAKDATNFVLCNVSAAITDNGTWDTVTISGVTLVGTISASDTLYVHAATSGADGAGDTSSNTSVSVDGEAAVFSGTTGKLLKRLGITGLVKAAAGVLSAATAGTDYVAPGGALGTPSSGTLTNCTGLPVAGITASTSTALGVGSVELGNASDTTVSRASAGVIAVEGVNLTPNIPVSSKSAAYTVVLADANTCIYHPSTDNNARTFTIDSNANVAYPVGTCLTFVNEINTVTIAITTDTLTMMGTGLTGSRSLAANGSATALKVASTKWIISGAGLS